MAAYSDRRSRQDNLPGLYRPLIKTGWIRPLSEKSAKSFGERIKIYREGFKVQLLRPSELRAAQLGSSALNGLVKDILATMSESSSGSDLIDVDVIGIRPPDPDRASGKLILLDLQPNDPLLAQREAVRKMVQDRTGVAMRGPEVFTWDVVLGVVRDDFNISQATIHNHLDPTVPLRVVAGPPDIRY